MNLIRFFFLILLASLPALTQEIPLSEVPITEGSWTIVEMSLNGKKVVPGENSPDEIVIKNRKLCFMMQGKALEHFKDFSLASEETSRPKKLDLIVQNTEKGTRHFLPAIYQVAENELTLGIALPQAETKLVRPTSFEESEKSGILLKARLKK
ncbi:MAG: hypothetical protein N2112_02255 [Gemmataceae bacterium]|jgi:uncharacterized protein (TIGR03067 family)|nr:hypothetical protein [Gemmataceae bacterium]